jgi:hypothetical protein
MLSLVPRPPLIASVVAIVIGIVLTVAGDDFSAVEVIGFVLLGLGAIGLVALAFYAVGRSEDLDRERRPRG